MRGGAALISAALAGCSPSAPAPAPVVDPPPTTAPAAFDLSGLMIKLERTECYGSCPAYVVEVRGDGSVAYCGGEFVKERGRRARTIPVAAVKQLADKFAEADFFNLQDEYIGGVDASMQILVLSVDGRSKRVIESIGDAAGMPPLVTEIGNAIDIAAKTAEWVGDVRARSGKPDACMETDGAELR